MNIFKDIFFKSEKKLLDENLSKDELLDTKLPEDEITEIVSESTDYLDEHENIKSKINARILESPYIMNDVKCKPYIEQTKNEGSPYTIDDVKCKPYIEQTKNEGSPYIINDVKCKPYVEQTKNEREENSVDTVF